MFATKGAHCCLDVKGTLPRPPSFEHSGNLSSGASSGSPMGMGCSQSVMHTRTVVALDPRVPFNSAEVEVIRAFWCYVKRKFEDTAREMLIRFFRHYPYFQCMFPELKTLNDELDMIQSIEFETMATLMLSIFDDVIENIDSDVDGLMEKLEQLAKMHSRVDGFHSDFFQYLEEPFIEALRERLWEKFGQTEEEMFRKLFKWVEGTMALEVEAIEYRLIPGD